MTDYLARVARLSEAVRTSWEVHQDAWLARDAAMLEAQDAGHSIGEIGKASGYTRGGVRSMLAHAAVARQDTDRDHHTPTLGS